MNDIADNHYIIEFFWMTKLGLTPNELRVYALIYSYSQDGQGSYYGAISYIQKRLSIKARSTVFQILKSLKEKKLIERKESMFNNLKSIEYTASPNSYANIEIEPPVRKSDGVSMITEPDAVQKSDTRGTKIGPNNISNTKGFISKGKSKDLIDKKDKTNIRDKDVNTPEYSDNSFDFKEFGKNHIFTRYLIYEKYLTQADKREYFRYDRLFNKMTEDEGWEFKHIKSMVQYFIYHYHDRLKVKTSVFPDGTVYQTTPTANEKIDNKYAYFVASIKDGKKAMNKQN